MSDKWTDIKQRLNHLGGSVDLIADGYEVGLRKVHDGKKIFVMVYINGQLKGEWTKTKDEKPVHPEAKFWRPMKRAAYKRKALPSLKRVFGKKEAERMITPRVIGFVPSFGTAGSAVAHLKKHFPDLMIAPEVEA